MRGGLHIKGTRACLENPRRAPAMSPRVRLVFNQTVVRARWCRRASSSSETCHESPRSLYCCSAGLREPHRAVQAEAPRVRTGQVRHRPPAAQQRQPLAPRMATGACSRIRRDRIGDILAVKIDEQGDLVAPFRPTLRPQEVGCDQLRLAVGARHRRRAPEEVSEHRSDVAVLVDEQRQLHRQRRVQRQGQVTATWPVRVVDMLPSGDLVVEGEKTIMTGDEEHQST